MELYNVEFKSSVKKDLKKLPKKTIKQIIREIEKLKKEPFPINFKKLIECDNLYRLRIGNYRVIYEVNNDRKEIIIYYVRHRKDIYRSL